MHSPPTHESVKICRIHGLYDDGENASRLQRMILGLTSLIAPVIADLLATATTWAGRFLQCTMRGCSELWRLFGHNSWHTNVLRLPLRTRTQRRCLRSRPVSAVAGYARLVKLCMCRRLRRREDDAVDGRFVWHQIQSWCHDVMMSSSCGWLDEETEMANVTTCWSWSIGAYWQSFVKRWHSTVALPGLRRRFLEICLMLLATVVWKLFRVCNSGFTMTTNPVVAWIGLFSTSLISRCMPSFVLPMPGKRRILLLKV